VCVWQDSEEFGSCEGMLPVTGLAVSMCVVCVNHGGVRGLFMYECVACGCVFLRVRNCGMCFFLLGGDGG